MPLTEEDYRVPLEATDENAFGIMGTARAARLLAEDVRDAYLEPANRLQDGATRPVVVLAENLAVAAWKLETAELDQAAKRTPEVGFLIRKYHEALHACFDAESLLRVKDFAGIRARYGSVSRDAAPSIAKGCGTGLIAIVVVAAVRVAELAVKMLQ